MSKKKTTPSGRSMKKKVLIAAAVVALIAIVLVSYFTSPAFLRTKTAGTIGDDRISEAEFAYFYQTSFQDIYNSAYQTYGEYTSYILDTNKSLNEQYYKEDYTWHQYITDTACASIEEVHALCKAASDAGYVLPDAQAALVDQAVESMEASAEKAGYSTSLYLRAVYGHGMNLKSYRSYVENIVLADAYSNSVLSSYTYTDEQIDAYYNANKQAFDTVDLRMISISGKSNEDGTVDLTEAKATAEEALATYKTEEELAQFGVDLDEEDAIKEPDNTLYTYVPETQLTPEGMADWFFDEARQYGDMEIFHDENSYYVGFFIGRHDIDYSTVTMRHILVQPAEKDEDGVYTEESVETALETINGYLEEWEASDKTEETFAEMANTYSSDEGSNTTGGLYEDIYKGQMTRVVNDWLFDEQRKDGDYTIVQSSYGFHLVLFCGETGNNYKTEKVSDAMMEADYQAWYDGIVADLTVSFKEDVGSVMLG